MEKGKEKRNWQEGEGRDEICTKDLREDLERRKEKEIRSELKNRQMDMRQELRKRYVAKSYDGPECSGQYFHRERRPGYYVRRTRDEFEYQPKQNYDHNSPTSRKRAPKQMWVAKGDMNQQYNQGNFIRATRLKMDSVFD